MMKTSIPMKQTIFFCALCILALGFQSCDEKPKQKKMPIDEFDLTIAKAEIGEANKEFMALVAAGDSIGLANSYTVDAKFMSAGAPSLVGRPNIQTAISNIIQSGITGIDLRLENVYGTEDLLQKKEN